MKPESVGVPTQAYTDSPSMVRVLSDGRVEMTSACNIMLSWQTTRLYNPETSEGGLAIRWAYNGQRFFESEGHRFAVDDNSYFLFNAGRSFSSYIQSETPVECFTVSFVPCLAGETLRSLVTPDDRLLDDPGGGENAPPVNFLEKAYPHDQNVTPHLQRLMWYRDSELATYGWFEEQFRELLVGVLAAHREVLREIEMVPAARAATRLELYRRLHRARDFMEAGLNRPLTIREIAAAAWFSPYHFLRLFKQVFRETPHQYLTRRRMEQAQYLLTKTNHSITDICFALGFESLGSFSWLFRRHLGVPPEIFRAQAARKLLQAPPLTTRTFPRAGGIRNKSAVVKASHRAAILPDSLRHAGDQVEEVEYEPASLPDSLASAPAASSSRRSSLTD